MKKFVRGLAVATAALTLTAGTAAAYPLPGNAQRTVTAGRVTFHLNLTTGTTTLPPAGGVVLVRGVGYNAAQGIFLAFCVIPGSVRVGAPATYTTLPTPCLGGREATDGSARRITGTGTGTPGVTIPYGPGGSFVTNLHLRPEIADGVVCGATAQCAIVTRADFTATADRSYDQYIPLDFAQRQ